MKQANAKVNFSDSLVSDAHAGRGQQVELNGQGLVPVKPKRVCQPFQGTLNKLISNAKAVAQIHGHRVDRFERDYSQGRAHGVCLECGGIISVDATTHKIVGATIKESCPKNNS